MVRPGRPLPRDAALVILPGSKATIGDLEFLRAEGWDIDLLAHRRHGGQILGLCGGYQMLGRTIADPLGVEGRPATAAGLGLLDIDTVLGPQKRLRSIAGSDFESGMAVAGYEMHLGTTNGPGLARPMLRLDGRNDGAVSADGLVAGCYLHGLFASDPFRRAFLARLGVAAGDFAYESQIEATLDRLADHLERHLDLAALLAAARPPSFSRSRLRWADEPHAQHQAAHDQAGELVEAQGAMDVRGRRPRRAVADPRVDDQALGIMPRPGERQIERPGHRPFGPAGIGRAVLAAVAQHDRHGPAGPAISRQRARRRRSATPLIRAGARLARSSKRAAAQPKAR